MAAGEVAGPIKVAVFDMDGTLVDSEALAYHAAEEGLKIFYDRRGLPLRGPTREERRALVGLPSLEYFAGLLPPEHKSDAPELRTLVAHHEVIRLKRGEGRLFPGVLGTLAELKSLGWKLALVSNCGRGYFNGNLEHLGLGGMMDLALCLDDFPTKIENVRQAVARLGGRTGVMVGDRVADLEAGRASSLKTVGCAYGFGMPGELSTADWKIASIGELTELLRSFTS